MVLKFMSFNILSDAPIWKKKWEHYEKEKWIYWDHRSKLILNIIQKSNADIICLTEVEHRYLHFFNNNLQDEYYYIYTSGEPKRTGDSIKKYKNWVHSMNSGIMILFRYDKIRLINNSALNYANYFRKLSKNKDWDDSKLNHFIKPCVSNTVLFEDIKENIRFYFTGVHHYNDPNYGDVKYYQMYALLKHIYKLNEYTQHPIIIAGDFNATPNSSVIKLIKTGKLDITGLYDKGINIPIENINEIKLPNKIKKYIPLISTYEKFYGNEPIYTTYTQHFKNCIDYIFISPDIKILKCYDIDNKIQKFISANKFMPNDKFPSDHINIIVDLDIK